MVRYGKLLLICVTSSCSGCRVNLGEQLGSFSRVVALKARRDRLTLMRCVGCGSDDRLDGNVKRELPEIASRWAARCWQHHLLAVEVGMANWEEDKLSAGWVWDAWGASKGEMYSWRHVIRALRMKSAYSPTGKAMLFAAFSIWKAEYWAWTHASLSSKMAFKYRRVEMPK